MHRILTLSHSNLLTNLTLTLRIPMLRISNLLINQMNMLINPNSRHTNQNSQLTTPLNNKISNSLDMLSLRPKFNLFKHKCSTSNLLVQLHRLPLRRMVNITKTSNHAKKNLTSQSKT